MIGPRCLAIVCFRRPRRRGHRARRLPPPRAGFGRPYSFVLLGIIFLVPVGGPLADSKPVPFRVGFSSHMFSDVNENDATAAVKVWGRLVAREHNVPIDPDPIIFRDTRSMLEALLAEKVDALGITVTEHHQISQHLRLDPLFLTRRAGEIAERYLLIVNRGGPIRDLGDLRGRSLLIFDNVRTALAPLWLEILLFEQGLRGLDHMDLRITRESRLAKAVLPVFFARADAALVTRSGLDTMTELNPQLQKQLEVLFESDPMVPAVFVFRDSYESEFKDKIVTGILSLNRSAAGQQVLTIFSGDDIASYPASQLDSATDVIVRHGRIDTR